MATMITGDDWRQRLDRHDAQIENIIKGLESEKQAREKGEDKFTTAFADLKGNFQVIKGGAYVMYFLIAVVLVPLLLEYVPKFIAWLKSL